jgi:multiple sugar transport system ATP-binding protein
MASINLDGVDKVYPNGHVAARGLDLEVADGEFLVMVGPSGCGKSTALRMVAGLETPTRGRILIGDRDVTARPPQERDLAMVFQNYALYPHMTARQNLEFGLRMRGTGPAARAERVGRVARALGIEPLLDRKPGQMSGGQRQRVALGRAIVREPQAFLLDEPLSNLDARLRVETRAELARLHRRLRATMLYVTHDQEEAMTLGDRVAVLRDGRVQQVAPPMEVYRRPANAFVAGFIGSPAMNFVPGRLAGDAGRPQFQSPYFRLDLDGAPPAPPPGPEVQLGVRPQDVRVVDPGDADAVGRVDVLQPLGSDVVVHLKLPGDAGETSLTVVLPTDVPVAVDDQVGVRFARDRLHLFAAGDGARLDAWP